jgi:ribosomal protein S18 acetylase RimI-like enzyme
VRHGAVTLTSGSVLSYRSFCLLAGLEVDRREAAGALLWRGSPWGELGWSGWGEPAALRRLLNAEGADGVNLPTDLAERLAGFRPQTGWTWHTVDAPLSLRPREAEVHWLERSDESEITALLQVAFPDAEAKPGDPRIARWCGVRASAPPGLVAVAAALWVGPSAGLLSSLAVHSTHRREGLGATVTAWFVRRVLQQGAEVVGLGAYATNTHARALYAHLGFAEESWVWGTLDRAWRQSSP